MNANLIHGRKIHQRTCNVKTDDVIELFVEFPNTRLNWIKRDRSIFFNSIKLIKIGWLRFRNALRRIALSTVNRELSDKTKFIRFRFIVFLLILEMFVWERWNLSIRWTDGRILIWWKLKGLSYRECRFAKLGAWK